MKNINIIKVMAAGVLCTGLAACHNQDVEFPDYENGISVYFAYQTPIREMMMGINDNGQTADNDTKTCKISTTMGGAYKGKNISVDIAVDKSLVKDLYFDAACTKPVQVLPDSYYNASEIAKATINYNGEMSGSVDVKLTDAFFNDPKCCEVNYVIPVVITGTTADHINAGELNPGVSSANRFDLSAWQTAPLDYTLYCVKYVSKYEGYYLPMGTITTNGSAKKYQYEAWERVPTDEHLHFQTTALNTVSHPIKATSSKTIQATLTDSKGNDSIGDVLLNRVYSGTLLINFSGNNGTVVGSGKGTYEHQEWDEATRQTVTVTEEVDLSVSGSATYTDVPAAKYNWASKDRCGMVLKYTATFNGSDKMVYDVDLDMALQRRGVGNYAEEFSVTLKQ